MAFDMYVPGVDDKIDIPFPDGEVVDCPRISAAPHVPMEYGMEISMQRVQDEKNRMKYTIKYFGNAYVMKSTGHTSSIYHFWEHDSFEDAYKACMEAIKLHMKEYPKQY